MLKKVQWKIQAWKLKTWRLWLWWMVYRTGNKWWRKITWHATTRRGWWRSKRRRKGLKILTSNKPLTRLPISLGQIKAGNNSDKLKSFKWATYNCS